MSFFSNIQKSLLADVFSNPLGPSKTYVKFESPMLILWFLESIFQGGSRGRNTVRAVGVRVQFFFLAKSTVERMKFYFSH